MTTSPPQVIAPNFKRRLSGVTSTVVRLVPLQAQQIDIRAAAPIDLPNVPQISLSQLLTLPRRPIVWHARRNIEMIAGLALKYGLRKDLRLLFTSASQRHHTGLTKWLIRRMDDVIATSAKTARYLERPAHVIHHGIDLDDFAPSADRTALRKHLGLPAKALLVGCYGRIRAQKGTDLFLDAMLESLPEHPRLHGIIMGRATGAHESFETELKDRAEQSGYGDRLHFAPEVPVWDMADWYAALDLYVAPQRSEGFGLTPLEAAACAVPSLAADVGAFSELILPDKTGWICPPDDLGALSTGLRKAIADPEQLATMGRAARAHAETQFTLKREADAVIAIYRQLLDEKPQP